MHLPDSKLRVKLIFNPKSGRAAESPQQLAYLLTCLQDQDMTTEVHLVHHSDNLRLVAQDAVERDFDLVVVSGGDGTISEVANGLVFSNVPLGIIPTGTRNNQALALGIPTDDLGAAVKTLRRAEIIAVDTGLVSCQTKTRNLIEVASMGLTSALFPSTDDIQHGELAKIGEFFRVLLEHPLTRIEADLNNGQSRVEVNAHMVLITNMPYTGANWKLADNVLFDDGMLDVFFFPEMDKLDLIDSVIQINSGITNDDRIWHYQVRSTRFFSDRPLPVMVDGAMLGECDLQVKVQPGSLRVLFNPALDRYE
jgi:YegS/Rv2252/BmrU family lipid kinase